MGDESDWVDEDDDTPGYVGGLGQMTTSVSTPSYSQSVDSPLLPSLPKPSMSMSHGISMGMGINSRASSSSKPTHLTTTNLNSRQGRGKGGGRSPAGRSSPLPGEATHPFDNGGRRTQLPTGRSGPAAIQEEDEDEEE